MNTLFLWILRYLMWFVMFMITYNCLHTKFEIVVLSGLAIIIAEIRENK